MRIARNLILAPDGPQTCIISELASFSFHPGSEVMLLLRVAVSTPSCPSDGTKSAHVDLNHRLPAYTNGLVKCFDFVNVRIYDTRRIAA